MSDDRGDMRNSVRIPDRRSAEFHDYHAINIYGPAGSRKCMPGARGASPARRFCRPITWRKPACRRFGPALRFAIIPPPVEADGKGRLHHQQTDCHHKGGSVPGAVPRGGKLCRRSGNWTCSFLTSGSVVGVTFAASRMHSSGLPIDAGSERHPAILRISLPFHWIPRPHDVGQQTARAR